MLNFCAFSGVRPGEAMALDWSDVNLPALRVEVSKRVYRGTTDLPKSNEVRTIALLPPARDALLTLPKRQGPVFRSKAGGRLCAPLLSSSPYRSLHPKGAGYERGAQRTTRPRRRNHGCVWIAFMHGLA